MSRLTHLAGHRTCFATLSLVMASAAASAQAPATASSGVVSVEASLDAANHYLFRGVRQNATNLVMWPTIEIGIRPYSGDGALKSAHILLGFWNSLHTGDTGSDGPSGRLWYEARPSAGVELRFARGFSVGSAYSSYTSPSEMFGTVKEISFTGRFDDTAALGRAALRPYAMVAIELDAQPGEGQLDGGQHGGKYFEAGLRPMVGARRIQLSVPVRTGLSLGDYYELAGEDHVFGFFGIGGVATVAVGRSATYGAWSIRGGVEYLVLGDAPKVFNGGDRGRTVGSAGIVWSR